MFIYQFEEVERIQTRIMCESNGEDITIGNGGQARIYKGEMKIRNIKNGKQSIIPIAIKRIPIKGDKINVSRVKELIIREASIYQQIKSPYILQYYGDNLNGKYNNLQNGQYVDFYFELCDGNLEDLLQTNICQDIKLSEKEALSYIRKIIKAIIILQQSQVVIENNQYPGVYHRDLKLQNILFLKKKSLIEKKKSTTEECYKYDIRLSDFGVSSLILSPYITLYVGSKASQAPQNHNNQEYDPEKNDVWAVGIMLLQMLVGQSKVFKLLDDLKKPNNSKLLDSLMNRSDISNNLKLKQTIKKCLEFEEKDRPTFQDIIKDPSLFKSEYKIKGIVQIIKTIELRMNIFQYIQKHLTDYINHQKLIYEQTNSDYIKQQKENQLKELEMLKCLLIYNQIIWCNKQILKYQGYFNQILPIQLAKLLLQMKENIIPICIHIHKPDELIYYQNYLERNMKIIQYNELKIQSIESQGLLNEEKTKLSNLIKYFMELCNWKQIKRDK